MRYNERINKFIELQNKNIKFEDIALELGIAKSTLRSFLNKNGYKLKNGKYELKEEDTEVKKITFEENSNKNIKLKQKKNIDNKETKTKRNEKESVKKEEKVKKVNSLNKGVKRQAPKKDRKINITQDDLDKLCEVYDWYMAVKDLKVINNKPKTRKKDIKVEDTNLTSLRSASIKVDKKTWEDFERLCSNSEFTKQEIITQALKDFMKEYKNLL